MNLLSVVLVQSILHWEDAAKNREMFSLIFNEMRKVDLIILPEMFNSGFSMQPQRFAETMQGDTVQWMCMQAKSLGSALCGSLAISEGASVYNRFVFVHPDGNIDYYDKHHCFRMSGEHQVYRAGEVRKVINYLGWRILPQVCYDLRFPVFSRNRQDYDLAIYVANWPGVRRLPWRTLLQARAIENLAYTIGVNRVGVDANELSYSGDSMGLSFNGDIMCDLGETKGVGYVELSLTDIQAFQDTFPAYLDSDDFQLSRV